MMSMTIQFNADAHALILLLKLPIAATSPTAPNGVPSLQGFLRQKTVGRPAMDRNGPPGE